MTEHVTAWLNAYHDGELHGRYLRQVEAHLAECAGCRRELEQLAALTALLQESPLASTATPPERFVSEVGLRLPRRPEHPLWRRGFEAAWHLTPLSLLGAWAFVQTLFLVTGVVWLALQLGVGGDALAWLVAPAPSPDAVAGLAGGSLAGVNRGLLYLFRGRGSLAWGFTVNLALLAVISLLYWSWLASWWVRHHRQRQVH
jgi:predicted anti-sigma-YlaC factor YlaD